MCGNSFHPNLISSALGKNDTVKRWVNGLEEGPSRFAADQLALSTYSELCGLIKQKAERDYKAKNIQVVQDLPQYPQGEKSEITKHP